MFQQRLEIKFSSGAVVNSTFSVAATCQSEFMDARADPHVIRAVVFENTGPRFRPWRQIAHWERGAND
jgi:hypothetical protein